MPLPKAFLLGFFVLSLVCFACPQTLLLPSPNPPIPEFAVATIKPASVNYIGLLVYPGGRVSGGNCTVAYLVMEAFHVSSSRITGGPDWVNKTSFDLTAIPPDNSPARLYMPASINSAMTDDQRLMLQALLRDRFGLRYHIQPLEQPVFFLRRTGKPLRLKPPKDPTSRPFMGVLTFAGGEANGEIEGDNTTMANTALRLSDILKRTVIDQTRLPGAYDFHVNAPDEKDADIMNATLEGLKSLGLELKAGKAPVDTVIIDQVNQPTPN